MSPMLGNLARLFMSFVLLLSGMSKIADVNGFMEVLRNLRILPSRVVRVASVGIPISELMLGGILAFGEHGTKVSAALASVLLILFSVVIGHDLLHGRSIECGCFGILRKNRTSWWNIVRNMLLIASLLIVYSSYNAHLSHWGQGISAIFLLSTVSVGISLLAEITTVFRGARRRRRIAALPDTRSRATSLQNSDVR